MKAHKSAQSSNQTKSTFQKSTFILLHYPHLSSGGFSSFLVEHSRGVFCYSLHKQFRSTCQKEDGSLFHEHHAGVHLNQGLHSHQRQPGEGSPEHTRQGLRLRGSCLHRTPPPHRVSCFQLLLPSKPLDILLIVIFPLLTWGLFALPFLASFFKFFFNLHFFQLQFTFNIILY